MTTNTPLTDFFIDGDCWLNLLQEDMIRLGSVAWYLQSRKISADQFGEVFNALRGKPTLQGLLAVEVLIAHAIDKPEKADAATRMKEIVREIIDRSNLTISQLSRLDQDRLERSGRKTVVRAAT